MSALLHAFIDLLFGYCVCIPRHLWYNSLCSVVPMMQFIVPRRVYDYNIIANCVSIVI